MEENMHLTEKSLKQISKTEGLSQSFILGEIKNNRATVLKNKKRKIKPVIVGEKFKCKYNLNLGISPANSNISKELKKLDIAISNGADTVMDLSVGKNCDKTRRKRISVSSVPFGTVPLYTMINDEADIKKISRNFIIDTIEKQCEDGVDFMTIHSGLLKRSFPYIKKRLTCVVSRGGSLILRYMSETGNEHPFYEYFDDIIRVLKK
jgi:phosphomethylpyrimidine synthase